MDSHGESHGEKTRSEESLEVESLTANFIPTKEVLQNLHQSGKKRLAIKGSLQEVDAQLTKGGDTKVLCEITNLGRENLEAKNIDNGPRLSCGLPLRDKEGAANLKECGLKLHDPLKSKQRAECHRAHVLSPNKRGIPPSP